MQQLQQRQAEMVGARGQDIKQAKDEEKGWVCMGSAVPQLV